MWHSGSRAHLKISVHIAPGIGLGQQQRRLARLVCHFALDRHAQGVKAGGLVAERSARTASEQLNSKVPSVQGRAVAAERTYLILQLRTSAIRSHKAFLFDLLSLMIPPFLRSQHVIGVISRIRVGHWLQLCPLLQSFVRLLLVQRALR